MCVDPCCGWMCMAPSLVLETYWTMPPYSTSMGTRAIASRRTLGASVVLAVRMLEWRWILRCGKRSMSCGDAAHQVGLPHDAQHVVDLPGRGLRPGPGVEVSRGQVKVACAGGICICVWGSHSKMSRPPSVLTVTLAPPLNMASAKASASVEIV